VLRSRPGAPGGCWRRSLLAAAGAIVLALATEHTSARAGSVAVSVPCLPGVDCPAAPLPSSSGQQGPRPAPQPSASPGLQAPAAASGSRDQGIGALISWVAGGAEWTSQHLPEWLSQPAGTGDWFIPVYQRMMSIGALLLLPFLLLAIFDAIRWGDPGVLVRSALIWLPLAVLLTISAVGIVQAGMAATDQLTNYVLSTPGIDVTHFFTWLGELFGALVAAGTAMALTGFAPGAAPAFAAALAVLAAGVGIFLELIFRQAAIYACTLFLPLAFASTIWPSARSWAKRLARLLFVAIASKFVVASVLVLGVAALGPWVQQTDPSRWSASISAALSSRNGPLGDTGVESMLVGAALVVMAFLGPIGLLNLLPTLEGALGQWQLHARSATATLPRARPRTVGSALGRAALPTSAPVEVPARVAAARAGRARPGAGGGPAPVPRPPRPRPPDGPPRPGDGTRHPGAAGAARQTAEAVRAVARWPDEPGRAHLTEPPPTPRAASEETAR